MVRIPFADCRWRLLLRVSMLQKSGLSQHYFRATPSLGGIGFLLSLREWRHRSPPIPHIFLAAYSSQRHITPPAKASNLLRVQHTKCAILAGLVNCTLSFLLHYGRRFGYKKMPPHQVRRAKNYHYHLLELAYQLAEYRVSNQSKAAVSLSHYPF